MVYLTILTDKETKEEKEVYCFNFIELLNLLPKLNPTKLHIQVTEVENVYDLELFLAVQQGLTPDLFWKNLSDKIDDLTDEKDDNMFGLN